MSVNQGKIYIFGDTHGTYEYHKIGAFEYQKEDFIIVCGDFGLLWNDEIDEKEQEAIETIKNLEATLLFIDGNHENFNRLDKLKKKKKFGSVVGEYIPNKAYHLLRGNIYEILGRKFLTLGGALSIDKHRRMPNVSWWHGEAITEKDVKNTLSNIEYAKHIDYVITHTCPRTAYSRLIQCVPFSLSYKARDTNMDELEKVFKCLSDENKLPAYWFFGHFHLDENFSCKSFYTYDEDDSSDKKDLSQTKFYCSYDTARVLDPINNTLETIQIRY